MSSQVHYEVFARRTPQAPWRLELATEDRKHAMESAEDMMAENRAAAVRVTKETLDDETMEFNSVTLLTKGAVDDAKRKPMRDPNADPVCTGPQDLYNSPAREKIQRLLDDWLRRNRATPFELLHRPDLVEKLEASGMELQHAIQKIAVPESQYSGQPVHEIIRAYQRLSEQAIERVIKAGRGQMFPPLTPENIGQVATKLTGHQDRLFVMGGSVCAAIAGCATWSEKVDRLLDLAEAAPEEPQPRALCQVVIEQPLAEIVGSRAGLADLLGEGLDLGGSLAALVRIAAPQEVEALIRMDKSLGGLIPDLSGPARRLGERLNAGDFKLLGTVLARRVLAELTGPRRLRPADGKGEIQILRALAMALTASAGRLLSLDEVQAAFVERSKQIVTADFVEAYLGQGDSAVSEAQALVTLCENVAGSANKRQAGRWLMGCVGALRFEKEMRAPGGESGPARLGLLADLQRNIQRCDLPEREAREITARIGEVGGLVEADVKICLQLSKAPAPAVQKLSALLKLASGEAAPQGPASDRAKAEVMKLMRAPEVRAELLASPEAAGKMRPLLQMAGLLAA